MTQQGRRPAVLALVVLILFGGFVALPSATAATPRVCDEVLLPMADGTRLHGWVNRTQPATPAPVLLTISSYQNDRCPGPWAYSVDPAVANQMTMVFINMRGTGASEGTFDLLGPQTADDVDRVVAWAAAAQWSNGQVVAIGASGNALFLMHAMDEPAVIAGVAQTACSDMYRCFHRGGSTSLQVGGAYLANMVTGYHAGLQRREANDTYTNPDPASQVAGLALAEAGALEHPTRDQYWQERSLLERLPETNKPIMFTTSNFDLLDGFDNWATTPNLWINLGISHSIWWVYKQSEAPARYRDIVFGQMNDFIGHFALNDRPAPPRVVQMISDGGFRAWNDKHAYLRTEPSWPPPGTRYNELLLSGAKSGSAHSLNDGSLGLTAPAAGADLAPLITAPGRGRDLRVAALVPVLGRANGGVDANPQAALLWDLRDEEAAGLTYTTPPLAATVELGGPVVARLWATSTAPDFTWVVRLTEVMPDGRSEWLTDGYLRAQMRTVNHEMSTVDRSTKLPVRSYRDYDNPTAVPPGPVEYTVQLPDVSALVRAGHRLRLDILPLAGTDYGTGDQPAAGTITVLRDPAHRSSVILPVVPGRCQDSVAMVESDAPAPICAKRLTDALR